MDDLKLTERSEDGLRNESRTVKNN